MSEDTTTPNPSAQDPRDDAPELSTIPGTDAGQAAAWEEPRPDDPYEGSVPPGYDWPTHGGYLGCLMGTIAGALLAGFLGSTVISVFWAEGALAGPLFLLVALVVFVACVVAIGRVGWIFGKRFYRAYEQPARPVWGEDDNFVEEMAPGTVDGSVAAQGAVADLPAPGILGAEGQA